MKNSQETRNIFLAFYTNLVNKIDLYFSERTPFQWDQTTSAGFSTASKTWLPVASNYKDINVMVERATPKSHLNVYMSLMRARSTRTMKYGKLLTEVFNENVLVILRYVLHYHYDAKLILQIFSSSFYEFHLLYGLFALQFCVQNCRVHPCCIDFHLTIDFYSL